MTKRPDAKSQSLQEHGTLNSRPHLVLDVLFQDSAFFDPRDLVLVKYEMLRRVHLEEMTVTEAAAAFGFSRPSFYQAQSLFQEGGLVGLIPKRPGPQHAHKLSNDVLDYLQQQQDLNHLLRAPQLSQLVLKKFGLAVHPRSIERALDRRVKRGR
ncbi:MAG: helix-turn-helix domain-containing protein [Bryobacteraceae bacterium]